MTLHRHLNYLELAHLSRVVVMAVEYRGAVAGEAIDGAFAALCAAHPVLRARVVGAGPDTRLVVGPDHRPEVVTLALDDGDPLARIAALPWDSSRSVAELVHLRGDGHGFLSLRTDHAISDGTAWLGFFRELLRILHDTARGDGTAPPAGNTLPRPPAEVFHHRIGVIPYDRRLFHSGDGTLMPDGSGEVISGYIRLTEEETNWLRTAARRYGTTVHGLVCGAVLLAQYGFTEVTAPARMFCVSPVDFRGRVDPAVGDLDTTNFMLSYVAEVPVTPRTSPVTIGRSVKKQMDGALAAMSGVRAAEPLAGSLPGNLSYALVSNLGVIPDLPAPGGLAITDLHIVNTVADTMFPGYYVYTYGGTLRIVYVHTARFLSPADVLELSTEIREQLLIAGASS